MRPTPWHPHHVAERYGLFTIIVLGEGVLAATVAFVAARSEAGLSGSLIAVAASALVLLFALWWLYFLVPAGSALEGHRDRGFLWGYGHYVVFASLAAVSAGIEVATEAITHPIEASNLLVGYGIAIPVALYLAALWSIHGRLGDEGDTRLRATNWILAGEVTVMLLIPLLTTVVPLAVVVALIALTAAALVVIKSSLRITG